MKPYSFIQEEHFYTATGTFSPEKECKHTIGWYCYSRFWIFQMKYFCCSDCGEFIKQWKMWRVE